MDSGIWTVRLIPQRIVTGRYDMWFPAGGVLNEGTGFLLPREETTLTIPSTAAKVITVGAYDARFGQLAGFSGRGFTGNGQVKPDLAAPGVEITSCAPGGGYTARSGTSMGNPVCDGERGTSDGMGDCARKRCVPVRRKNKGVPGSAERVRWEEEGLLVCCRNIRIRRWGGELYVCRTVCRSRENKRIVEVRKKTKKEDKGNCAVFQRKINKI